MTAPLSGPGDAVVEAAKLAAERYMTGGAYDEAMERAALDALTAAWPLIVRQIRTATIEEIADLADKRAEYWRSFADGSPAAQARRGIRANVLFAFAGQVRALLPPVAGEKETNDG